MLIYILLYSIGKDNEGIHSLEMNGRTIVLMFEERDDAERYCGLLEAQDFPCPKIELISTEEVIEFCNRSGYEAKLVEKGFIPKNDEERLLLSPPERNLDVELWTEKKGDFVDHQPERLKNSDLESYKKQLEDLL